MRTLPSLLASTLLLAALAGCGSDDPEPKLADPTSPAAIESDSLPSTAGSAPPTSTTANSETAEEFVARWQSAAYRMQVTGNTRPYEVLTKACESCDSLVAAVTAIYADGGYLKMSPPVVDMITRVGEAHSVTVLEFQTTSQNAKTHDASGAVTSIYKGGTERFQVNVKQFGGRWKVLRYSKIVEP